MRPALDPYALLHLAHESASPASPPGQLRAATYNVHRWTGAAGGNRWRPELASAVIAELDADVIALQEVLSPYRREDPLLTLAEELGMHLAFVCTRSHRYGDLGNAILSRFPVSSVFSINLSHGRLEQRSAVAALLETWDGELAAVATHLALVDRTRRRQVQSLLSHPRLEEKVVLLGDMNAWRRCQATRRLDNELTTLHNNRAWPPSFPARRPVLALDRVYARGADVEDLRTHDTPTARRGSDHLPVIARIRLNGNDVRG